MTLFADRGRSSILSYVSKLKKVQREFWKQNPQQYQPQERYQQRRFDPSFRSNDNMFTPPTTFKDYMDNFTDNHEDQYFSHISRPTMQHFLQELGNSMSRVKNSSELDSDVINFDDLESVDLDSYELDSEYNYFDYSIPVDNSLDNLDSPDNNSDYLNSHDANIDDLESLDIEFDDLDSENLYSDDDDEEEEKEEKDSTELTNILPFLSAWSKLNGWESSTCYRTAISVNLSPLFLATANVARQRRQHTRF